MATIESAAEIRVLRKADSYPAGTLCTSRKPGSLTATQQPGTARGSSFGLLRFTDVILEPVANVSALGLNTSSDTLVESYLAE